MHVLTARFELDRYHLNWHYTPRRQDDCHRKKNLQNSHCSPFPQCHRCRCSIEPMKKKEDHNRKHGQIQNCDHLHQKRKILLRHDFHPMTVQQPFQYCHKGFSHRYLDQFDSKKMIRTDIYEHDQLRLLHHCWHGHQQLVDHHWVQGGYDIRYCHPQLHHLY